VRTLSCPTRLLTGALTGLVLTVGLPLAGALANGKPDFQVPFACGEQWYGSTRPTHSPSPDSIDWSRDAYDLGKLISASAPGIVTSVTNLGNTSYGRYVVVDDGNGWTTLYAHLRKAFVVVGQRVDQGQTIALLGSSGGSTGPHLHYEQRLDRADRPAAFDRTRFVYNSWLASRNCGDVPVAGDWNGDKITNVGIFVRRPHTAAFRQRLADGGVTKVLLGRPTDTPVIGDWNGDGRSDLGVWTTQTGTFTLRSAPGLSLRIRFGDHDDVPVTGDWNGDGRSDVGAYDPATSTFSLRGALGGVTTKAFGIDAGLPVTGDWNGDGRTDVGMYYPGTSTFRLALPDGTTKKVVYGTATSLPVIGNWNADAVSDLGVWDTATGVFSKRVSDTRTSTVRFGHHR
jgi:Peptidase family M23